MIESRCLQYVEMSLLQPLLAHRKKVASQILQHCPHSINVIKLEGEFALIQALQIRPIKHENMLLLAAFQAVDVNDLEDSNQIDE